MDARLFTTQWPRPDPATTLCTRYSLKVQFIYCDLRDDRNDAYLVLLQCTSRIFVRSGCASIYHSTAKAGRAGRVQPCTNPLRAPPPARPPPPRARQQSSHSPPPSEPKHSCTHAYPMRDDAVVEPTLIKYSVLIVDLACQARRTH